MDEERYAFEVTWYDNLAEITRRFMLMYFVRHTGDNEVEMIDLKTNKKFNLLSNMVLLKKKLFYQINVVAL